MEKNISKENEANVKAKDSHKEGNIAKMEPVKLDLKQTIEEIIKKSGNRSGLNMEKNISKENEANVKAKDSHKEENRTEMEPVKLDPKQTIEEIIKKSGNVNLEK